MSNADQATPFGKIPETPDPEPEPVMCAISRTFRFSIKIKLLIALLGLAIFPLIICTTVLGFMLNDVQHRGEQELLKSARTNFMRLAEDQATIANAMLDKIRTETRMVAYAARTLPERAPRGRARSLPSAPEDKSGRAGTPRFLLAPDVREAAVRNKLKALTGLDGVFRTIRDVNPILNDVYYCTKDEICRRLPGYAAEEETKLPAIERDKDFIPSQRPWYRKALARDGVVWSKYTNAWRGKQLFSLDPAKVGKIGGKASPALVREMAAKQIGVVPGSEVVAVRPGEWQMRDKIGKLYVLRKSADRLNVYGIDVLTCSLAVPGPDGRPVGVAALDISMEAISQKIIHTPDEVPGYAFLLNEQGELIEQERARMAVPGPKSDIRQKMMAGEKGIMYDPVSSAWIAYAPIRSIHSADEKSYWSLGVSVPNAEIVRVTDEMHQTLVTILKSLALFFMLLTAVVIAAAIKVSKCITRPIVQLSEGAARFGEGNLNHRLSVKTGDEVEVLANDFNKMADNLKDYIRRLKETTAVKERFESELRVAQEIQMSFLKKIFPPFPDRDDVTLYAMIDPAKEVAGDLFDFGFLDDDHIVFYVGDVSDKGTPAALIMAMTITLMKRAYHQAGATPAKILQEVNKALAEDNENAMFVTLFIGILDVKSGELIFSNAGHNPPLILSADGTCRYLDLPDGMVLGVIPDTDYADDRVHLNPGDMIVTYTDGVTEAMNPAHELYSEERLQAAVAAEAGHSVDETVAAILASVKNHVDGAPQSDDITILALKRSVQP